MSSFVAGDSLKGFRHGADRAVSPVETLARIAPLTAAMGITRVANITGLDRVGLPVVAVIRPNSRSLSVAQGKGITLAAAKVSGLMEAIESFHAETLVTPLLLGSYRELRAKHLVVDVSGLPRLATSRFNEDSPILWAAGTDLFSNRSMLVPYELVHTDFRRPFPTGSGAFIMSSNGLSSGNTLEEAINHALCEVVERDSNTLYHFAGAERQAQQRINLATIDDDNCRAALDLFEKANLCVGVWETTSDIGIPSFLCTIGDRDPHQLRPMPSISGSGCHPRRAIALLRALTEAAQGRVTFISGSRDDLSDDGFEVDQTSTNEDRARLESATGYRSFSVVPDFDHQTFREDIEWQLCQLRNVGLRQAIVLNLTRSDYQIPVVRVIVPHLESTSEIRGYLAGRRARRSQSARGQ